MCMSCSTSACGLFGSLTEIFLRFLHAALGHPCRGACSKSSTGVEVLDEYRVFTLSSSLLCDLTVLDTSHRSVNCPSVNSEREQSRYCELTSHQVLWRLPKNCASRAGSDAPHRGGDCGGDCGACGTISESLCRLCAGCALLLPCSTSWGGGGGGQRRQGEPRLHPRLRCHVLLLLLVQETDACGRGGNLPVHERSEPGLHSRWRGRVLFPLLLRERGACLLPQRQEAARGCRLRRQPERVTPAERRQAAKTACSLPTHRPGVGATFLCSWAARWCPSTYFLQYSAQIRYWAPHPFSVSSRTCTNLNELHELFITP